MISYAGVPLLLPDEDGELARFLDHYLPLEDLRLFGERPVSVESNRTQSREGCGARTGLGRPNYPAPPRLKINSLYWPTGASRWAHGLFLCTGAALLEILPTVTSASGSTSAVLKMSDEDRQSLSTSMHLLPPRKLTAVVDPDNDSLWLLPLVDERWFWQLKNAGDMEVTSSSTWASVFTALGTAIGSTIEHVAADADYFKPDPTELTRRYENAAVLMDSVAHSVGQRIVRDLDGTVYSLDWTTSDDRLGNNLDGSWGLLAGADFSGTRDGAVTPQYVRVVFPTFINRMPDKDRGVFSVIREASSYGFTVFKANATKTIFSTAAANGDSTPDNESDLTTLATQIASDFYASLVSRYDYAFASIKPWLLTGYDDHVEWSFGFQRKDLTFDARTRVQSAPYNFGVEEMQHQVLSPLLPCSELQLLRLESDLCRGGSATARIVSCATSLTLPGDTVTVTDPTKAAFCKGSAAGSGSTGGDSQGQANLIWGRPCGSAYRFVNGGTYYRYIEGTLAAGQISTPWKVLVGAITGYDGEFLYGIQAGISGASDYITLSGTPCGSPMDGLAFGAVAHDCGAYRVIWMCCA